VTSLDTNGESASRGASPTAGTGLEAVDEMLAAPFEVTHHDVRGGVPIEYLSGEQVIHRLLAVLGSCGWSFRLLQHDIHPEADEVWVLGELRLHLNPEDPVVRQQFGSSKIKRARSTGAPLDIGFDLKSAATDCLKKCATLVGVGLYLTRKEDEQARASAQPAERNGSRTREHRQRSAGLAEQAGGASQATTTGRSSQTNDTLRCDQCSQQLQLTKTRDGGNWTPAQLAAYTRREHNRTLCTGCVRSLRAGIPERSTADSAQD
jgi:hypothetical protein